MPRCSVEMVSVSWPFSDVTLLLCCSSTTWEDSVPTRVSWNKHCRPRQYSQHLKLLGITTLINILCNYTHFIIIWYFLSHCNISGLFWRLKSISNTNVTRIPRIMLPLACFPLLFACHKSTTVRSCTTFPFIHFSTGVHGPRIRGTRWVHNGPLSKYSAEI